MVTDEYNKISYKKDLLDIKIKDSKTNTERKIAKMTSKNLAFVNKTNRKIKKLEIEMESNIKYINECYNKEKQNVKF